MEKYSIRVASRSDIPVLLKLESECWHHSLRLTESQLSNRFINNPDGHYVIEESGAVHGVIYSQRINSERDLSYVEFDTADTLHQPDGPVAHVLSLNILPEKQSLSLGDQLLEFLLSHLEKNKIVRNVFGVTRCKDYAKHKSIPLEEYIKLKNENGRIVDTVLRMHQLHGAEVKYLVPNYRPGDIPNNGNGVLVGYDLEKRQARIKALIKESQSQTIKKHTPDIIQSTITTYLRKTIGDTRANQFSQKQLLSTPIFELGIDSADLLDLKDRISEEFDVSVEPLFFFENNTGAKIINVLEKQLVPKKIAVAKNKRNAKKNTGTKKLQKSQVVENQPVPHKDSNDIAIVGVSCKLPGGIEHYSQLWELLLNEDLAVGELPDGRWQWPDKYADLDHYPGIKAGGYMNGIDEFDARHFRISPYEAQNMDPQQRILLQLSWACIEDAGYSVDSMMETNTGVFVGASGSDYQRLIDENRVSVQAHSGTSTSMAVIANRLSYFYNLQGPSIQIDTACSSSLVAMHTAVQSIRRGECENAIVGGVNVMCHPRTTIAYYEAGMLSPEGRCRTFDKSANGYARSEGCIVMMIKSLAKAITDKDHIYAVIKGSSVNHGGQTGGLTIPNADKQATLIQAALTDAKIKPEWVDYFEAHGTGTPLGDPIEVSGIQKVFDSGKESASNVSKSLGIGSVKSNLGHLEAVAGLAGLLKVLLCFKHEKIPPNVGFRNINPKIDINNSSVFIVDRLIKWQKGEASRIANVSSFGSGGSNAQIVVADFNDSRETTKKINKNPITSLIVLSAATEQQLKEQVKLLLKYLSERKVGDNELPNIAYTLQVGRRHMKTRIAIRVKDIDSMKQSLTDFISSQTSNNSWVYGQGETNSASLSALSSDDDLNDLLRTWVDKGKYSSLMELWVNGLEVDWSKFYDRNTPFRRVSLPTYVFSRERFWLDLKCEALISDKTTSNATTLHPLVHINTSTFSSQQFETTFSGDESFLRDHIINKQKILPGVAYLEMVRFAVEQSVPELTQDGKIIQLENIAWFDPVIIDKQEHRLRTQIRVDDSEGLQFEVSSEFGGDYDKRKVHCSGNITVEKVDIGQLVRREEIKSVSNPSVITKEEMYAFFQRTGFNYGMTHQIIRQIQKDEKSVIAELSLGQESPKSLDTCLLHPSIMDAAIQAAYALFKDRISEILLPYAIDSITIIKPCNRRMFASVKKSERSSQNLNKYDIALVNENDELCVNMRGLTFLPLNQDKKIRAEHAPLQLLEPFWEPRELVASRVNNIYDEQLVFFCGFSNINLANYQASLPINYERIDIEKRSVSEQVETIAAILLDRIKLTLKQKYKNQVLFQCVVPYENESSILSSLSGLFASATLENPKFRGQVISIDPSTNVDDIIRTVKENAQQAVDRSIRYIDTKRQVLSLREIDEDNTGNNLILSRDNVCVITGGLGGIGWLVLQDLVNKTSKVTYVLTGRRPKDERVQTLINETDTKSNKVVYYPVDVNDDQAVEDLVSIINEQYGQIDGLIHAAGIIQDNYILKKDEQELKEVLSPKVRGTVNLDKATQSSPLKFFITFSSVVGYSGNAGQADYAVANAFLRHFSDHRNHLVDKQKRCGKTISIAWPLWKDGGMKIDVESEELMARMLGLLTIDSKQGIHALHQCMSLGKTNIIVFRGDKEKFTDQVCHQVSLPNIEKESHNTHQVAETSLPDANFIQSASRYIKGLIATVLKIPEEELDDNETFETYGIDSILIIKLTNELEKSFGTLAKTLFFEYQNFKDLVHYFLTEHRERLEDLIITTSTNVNKVVTGHSAPNIEKDVRHIGKQNYKTLFPSSSRSYGQSSPLDIAIVGISGRYPGADNVSEYWQNLCDGKDCITEVPKSRWDWQDFYNEDAAEQGLHRSKWGGFINGVDEFDPLFFNISPHEACLIDPQERLFLEHAWIALEDAGYTRNLLRSEHLLNPAQVGVYAGVMYGDYQLFFNDAGIIGGNPSAVGSIYASIANRVSYFLNVHGPSMAVDTMCSSSLTSLHLACQDLRSGNTDMGIAGGVNVTIHPSKYLSLSLGKFISNKGLCESFGEGGDGYIPGEGVGVAILKRLEDAERDADHIYGVIKGSALSHGGRTSGYTVPNPVAQKMAIEKAIIQAKVDPKSISYVEAHGTGTKLGDPIEISALTQAYGSSDNKQYCYIGSAKSNIGHCESAAGIAGVTKVLMQLQHKKIAPSLHSAVLNPNINFSKTPFVVNQSLREWKYNSHDKTDAPRIAGVSSFGAGGSNAHLIIEEYVEPIKRSIAVGDTFVVPVSAKNEETLKVYLETLLRDLEAAMREHSEIVIEDIAYTFQIGREAMESRISFVVSSIEELIAKLQNQLTEKGPIDGVFTGVVKKNKELVSMLSADEEMSEAVQKWVERRKYSKLAGLWVKGLPVDWAKLYGDTRPKKISITTYPFEKERYWVPEQQEAEPRTTNLSNNDQEQYVYKFLKKSWQAYVQDDSENRELKHTLVCYSDDTKLLARKLEQRLGTASLVQQNELSSLTLSTLVAFDSWINISELDSTNTSFDVIEVLQRFIENNRNLAPRFVHVTRGLEAHQNATPSIHGASLSGLHRMLQHEYSAVSSTHIDLDPEETSIDQDCEQLIRTINNSACPSEIIYRKRQCFESKLKEIQLNNDKEFTFNSEHVLLITGGTKGIGSLCAKHFVSHYGVRKLVITGREQLPERDTWNNLANISKSIKDKIALVKTLEGNGVKVEVLSLALDDPKQVKEELDRIEKQMGPIAGVIHSAGLVDQVNPAFIRKTEEGIKTVLSPKVAGTQTLVNSLKTNHLQFVFLFSSVSSIIPSLGAGQTDYVMANAFMDYFAQHKSPSMPIVSVQWPSWKDVGFGEVTNQAYKDTGLTSITNSEGLELLDKLLRSIVTPVIMPVRVSETWLPKQLMSARKQVIPVVTKAASKKQATLPAQSVVNMPLEAGIDFLDKIFLDELKMKPGQLDYDTPFADYGVDSIIMAQIIQSLNRSLEVQIDPSILLEHTTLTELATWLADKYPEKFSSDDAIENEKKYGPSSDKQLPLEEAPLSRKFDQENNESSVHLGRGKVAVVGMACRFPGAKDIEEYWRLLEEGRSAIRKVPDDCWGKSNDYYAGLVDDVYGIDPAFFMLPDEDVKRLDPQAIVLLEETLKAIYNAGYSHEELNGSRTGVYIGARNLSENETSLMDGTRNPIRVVGQNYLAANISQFFNFTGPSMVIDTACSSALVAMQMASDALKNQSIDYAIVAGVSILSSSFAHDIFAKRNLLQKEGIFHVFDNRASGVVLGEGCGVVVLKRMSTARRDGNTVYAKIESIGINNDGRTAGPASPNIVAQKSVMLEALRQADIDAKEINFLDANGTGSAITDLLELKSIESVYSDADRSQPLFLGSMKPNIGHPLCAEGIASFIKVALMLHKQSLVPFLSGQEPLTHFDIEASKLEFPYRAVSYPINYAAINSFADGGTNGHVILGHSNDTVPRVSMQPKELPLMKRMDARTLKVIDNQHGILKSELKHKTTASSVWSSTFSQNNPILANHLVFGQAVLPGMAWVDVIYQWLAEAGLSYEQHELRNLSIFQPLIATHNKSVNLNFDAQELDKGNWQLVISQETGNDQDSSNIIVTTDIVRINQRAYSEQVDINRITESSIRQLSMSSVYDDYKKKGVIHEDFMKTEGSVYVSSDEYWIQVTVDDSITVVKNNQFLFNPALLDGYAVGARGALLGNIDNDEQLYLPLYFESFYATQPIQDLGYCRVSFANSKTTPELIIQTLEYFSPSGHKIGELNQFKTKAVRDPGVFSLPQHLPSYTSPNLENEIAESYYTSLEELLFSIVSQSTGKVLQNSDGQKGYYELGMDSITLLNVVNRINSFLNVKLPPTLLFEYTTISSLCYYLNQEYGSQVKKALLTHGSSNTTQTQNQSTPDKITNTQTDHSAVFLTHSRYPHNQDSTGAKNRIHDIAIIGIAGRYPQANNIPEFWENLIENNNCITTIPTSRWPSNYFENTLSPSGKVFSKWGGFIDNPKSFDPSFFNISDQEAAEMDPQERQFLEVCWETIEDAGYIPETVVAETGELKRRKMGVFVGVMHHDYAMLQSDFSREQYNIPIALNASSIANRVSYAMNLHGPSVALDAACASSLTSVHMAIESIKNGESDVAIAGGVNLSLHPSKYQSYGMMDMHASDGQVHSFGIGGDGYVSSEGVGAVLLKPLQQAIEDQDAIYAVIKASTINHVGKSSGMTVPNPNAQEAAFLSSLEQANIDAKTISYVEAHATGTELGDSIEMEALKRVMRKSTDQNKVCAVGTVKNYIGHAESAAGISALTKTVLQLKHKKLLRSMANTELNLYFDTEDTPFRFLSENEDWHINKEQQGEKRRAVINSVGATGSCANILIEEPPSYTDSDPDESYKTLHLIPLSAHREDELHEYARKLLHHLNTRHNDSLSSIAYTLQTGRQHFKVRIIMKVNTLSDLCKGLEEFIFAREKQSELWHGQVRDIESSSHQYGSVQETDIAGGESKINYEQIAMDWVSGKHIDWQALQASRPSKAHLPTYPFNQKDYWFSNYVTQNNKAKSKNGNNLPFRNHWVEFVREQGVAKSNDNVVNLSIEEKAVLLCKYVVAKVMVTDIDEINVDDGFYSMGMSSSGVIEAAQTINHIMNVKIKPSELFNSKTITELAQHLKIHYQPELEQIAVIEKENISSEVSFSPGESPPSMIEVAKNEVSTDAMRQCDVDKEVLMALKALETGENDVDDVLTLIK